MEVFQEFGFDAAHRFPGAPDGHPNQSLHGHSFVARVVLAGAIDPRTGFVADLGEVEKRCLRLRERLDHSYLNEVEGLAVPSLENIAVWIWKNLKPEFPALARVEVRRESCRHGCVYTGA